MIYYHKKGNVMKPLKNKVSITLDETVIEKIKDLAEEDDRNFSQYVNMVLKDWIKHHEQYLLPPPHPARN